MSFLQEIIGLVLSLLFMIDKYIIYEYYIVEYTIYLINLKSNI